MMNIAIVGGGIGGLTLAQGLFKAGINVSVYERDESPDARQQGFRVHIDPRGSTALHQCLPSALWQVFDATGGDFGEGFTVVTEKLEELLAFRRTPEATSDPVARHRSISRITLRRILLHGIEPVVHFGKRFLRYETLPGGGLKLLFADGSSAIADVLVGADGVNSGVRKQYLPDADPVDTGVLAIGGKVPLTDGVMALAPVSLLDGPAIIMPASPCSLFMALWKRSPEASEPLRRLGIQEPLAGDENYLILGLGGRPKHLRVHAEPSEISSAEMKQAMRRVAARWHPDVRKLIEMVEEDTITATKLRTSLRPKLWQASTVTLLGDAIHNMTPYRGIGANIALRDAALLCERLTEVHHSRRPLLEGIAEYEVQMRDYGFAAVEASLKAMEQAVQERTHPRFGVMKAAMRVVNAVPPLKRIWMPA